MKVYTAFSRGGAIDGTEVFGPVFQRGVDVTLTTAQIVNVSSLTTIIAALPTTLPASPGNLWLNGGVLSMS